MLWALISSVYVIYLYGKLKAERTAQPEKAGGARDDLRAEIDRLNAQIGTLEQRLASREREHPAR